MAIDLVQFWQQERDAYDAQRLAAQNDLGAAQAALTDAKGHLATDAAKLADGAAKIAAARAKLATVSVPSEVAALNEQIRDLIIEQRATQGVILDDQDAVDAGDVASEAASAALARASARLADADAKLAKAKDAKGERDNLKDKLAKPPFDTLKADATAFAAGQVVTDATAQLTANFPTELQTIAGKRHDTRTKRVASLRTVM